MILSHPSEYGSADRAPAFASRAASAVVRNSEIGRMQTAYAIVFRGAFAASASTRAEIASKVASLACSIDAMA
jgi:hypothetical protein